MNSEKGSLLVASIIAFFIGLYKVINQNGWHLFYGLGLMFLSIILLVMTFRKRRNT